MIRPKCPKCEMELDLNSDLLWENLGAFKGAGAAYYCSKCGSILGVGPLGIFRRNRTITTRRKPDETIISTRQVRT